MKTLITGANRGLGLEFVRQCLERGETVVAGCRKPSEASELQSLASERLTIEPLDVADEASIHRWSDRVVGPVDRLINNAGIYGGEGQSIGHVSAEMAASVYRVNVIGPMLLMQSLEATLASDAVVVNISSGYGSIANSGAGWPIMYCCSKAALNMLASIVGQSWPDRCVVAMSPGWVQTDMGGADADLTPQQSIGNMLDVIDGLTREQSGSFLNHTGQPLPF